MIKKNITCYTNIEQQNEALIVDDQAEPYQALYLHIPFCASRCGYCDFATAALDFNDPAISNYIDQLILDIRKASRAQLLGDIRTIYIGGGTPSYIGHKEIVRLVYALTTALTLSSNTEFSIEVNPDSLTAAMTRDLYSLGVNRFSVGIQSFNENELLLLGRRHNVASALDAVKIIQERCENVSIDLMCGIPLQTLKSWQKTLTIAADIGVKHVSVYPLSIESGTPFDEYFGNQRQDNKSHCQEVEPRSKNGDLREAILEQCQSKADTEHIIAMPSNLPNEDEQAEMMLMAAAMLGNAGFARYEIASFAQPGYQCQHNCAYWSGLPYLGLGSSAASMRNLYPAKKTTFGTDTAVTSVPISDSAPTMHTSDAILRKRYCEGIAVEELNAHERALEDVILALRMSSGVSWKLLSDASVHEPDLLKELNQLQSQGLLQKTATGFSLSERGWLLGNIVFAAIWDLASD